MKISALIPTYNRRKYVTRAIESILAQSVPVDEIIVVDDGSTDGTAEEIESRFGERVRVVRQANGGVSSARRRAILEAKGEWVAFLDSDDEWVAGRQEELQAAADQLPPEVAWLFGDLRVVTDEGDGATIFREHGLEVTGRPQIFDDAMEVQFPVQFPMLQASWIRREALLRAGCFGMDLRSDEDLLAGFQIACLYKFAAIASVVTRFYRTSDLYSTSVFRTGVHSADYHRSRMIAFSMALKKTKKRDPWALLYAEEVRGLCKLRGRTGQPFRRLSLQQLRYGVSMKSLAFLAAAMFGKFGLSGWEQAAELARASGSLRRLTAEVKVHE
jgi:glycosyltransferase involved in cell wall biosynthesis